MARYSVQLAPSAERDLSALDKPVQRRVAARIDALAENPRPAGVTKLQGEANAWRIRVGDYRILYTIEDRRLVVLVIKIGHRREVYRSGQRSKVRRSKRPRAPDRGACLAPLTLPLDGLHSAPQGGGTDAKRGGGARAVAS
ncbi:MAG: type II toxin-antitoxin system RelE/ParE family toxin [Polyangia bacterium]